MHVDSSERPNPGGNRREGGKNRSRWQSLTQMGAIWYNTLVIGTILDAEQTALEGDLLPD